MPLLVAWIAWAIATPDPMAQAIAIENADPKAAIALLSPLADSAAEPNAARADYERARITDTLLHDPKAAAQLYRAHLSNYPSSPYLSMARSRADYLAANMGECPEALAEFEAVAEAWGRHASADLVPRMEHAALSCPTSPIRDRALFWLSSQRVSAGDSAGGVHWLEVLIAGSSAPKDVHRAELQIAVIESRARHYARALEIERRYLDSADPLARELARNQLESTLDAQLYDRLFALGLSLIAALFLGLLFGVRRRRAALRPLPFEVKLYLPIAALLSALTLAEDRRVGLAVLGIVISGGILAVLNGAYLRSAHPRGPWRLLYLGAVGGAAISLGFCAVHLAHLTDLVITTLTQGADR